MFVDSDDEYFVILRLDDGLNLRIFGSDVAFAQTSGIGEVLLGELEESEVPAGLEDEDLPADSEPVGKPVGDADLLSDLGISARDLVSLCGHGGLLPSDLMLEVCRKVGCADVLLELRGE